MFPDRTAEIIIHKGNAYKALRESNFDRARDSFFRWVESVRQQNINTNGKFEKELEEAKKEYSEFVKQDPLYIEICKIILLKIKEQPDMLQTEIYILFPQFSKDNLSYALYFAAEHGKITRLKKGRTYSLTIK